MYLHELLMKARQDEMLRAAARERQAANARLARRSEVRPARPRGWRRSRLLTAGAGARPAVTLGPSDLGGATAFARNRVLQEPTTYSRR
jgi:hypothetical protein